MAKVVNFIVEQGTDFSKAFVARYANNTVVNLTGGTLSAELRSSYAANTFTAFTASITDAANGKFTLTMSNTLTTALSSGRFVYDVEMSVGGTISRLVEGIATVTPEVTRG